MFERVGKVQVLLDGEVFNTDLAGEEVVSEWDLADMLANAKYSRYWGDWAMSKRSEEKRREAWDQWIQKAYDSRVELGLPVKEKVLE